MITILGVNGFIMILIMKNQMAGPGFLMQQRLVVMDFMNFSQMVLNGGTFNGQTILQPETVSLMFQNAVPAQAMPIGDRGYWLGSGWTLGGFNLVMDASAYNFPVSDGTIWWDGSAATRFFIDPKQDTVIVIMSQVSPSSGGGFREDFSNFIDQAIIERR